MEGGLDPRRLQLDLGPAVKSAGLAVVEHAALIRDLADIPVEGLPLGAVAKRRAEFLAGRFAAREALRALGIEALVGRNADGSPRWPRTVVGSITHGAERALCAVALSTDVRSLGIDAEHLMSSTTRPELRERICAEGERALLARELAAPEHHLITFAFSAKESLYKCLYPLTRQFMDFRAARVVAAAGTTDARGLSGELTLELSVDWSSEFRLGQRLRALFRASERHVESAVLLPG